MFFATSKTETGIGNILLCLVTLYTIPVYSGDVPDSLLKELHDKVRSEQAKETEPFVPFKQLYHRKGVYGSYVKLNFYGNLASAEARRLASVYDNNMFATAWVTSSLLEAHLVGNGPTLAEDQLINAIDSMAAHHDKNKPYNNSLMTFWEQQYNDTTKYYQSAPTNLIGLLTSLNKETIEDIEDVMKFLGLDFLEKEFEEIMRMKDVYIHVFKIPPDFDDTFVNIGLGSLLAKTKEDFPNAWNKWITSNSNLTSVFDAVKKYAYRPFSDDADFIDPRTYYWARDFITQAKERNQTVALITTWIQNEIEMRTEIYKGVTTPYLINNVDATVAANTVYGMTAAVLNGLVSPSVLDDPLIEWVYHNTSSLIAHEIATNMSNRPDLALLYYPSQIEFYWFVARTLDLMETALLRGPLPRKVMATVYATLKNASESEMTKYILLHGKSDGRGGFYYDDFLGDGDLTLDNKTKVRGEDRIFTTTMAINALLYTWTVANPMSKEFGWKQGTPEPVKSRVDSCVKWLTEHVVGREFEPWNAFFSGSLKTRETNAFNYPMNRYEFLKNGTAVNDTSHFPRGEYIVSGMKGYVSPADYENLLKEKSAKYPVPTVFNGYNTGSFPFPLWSSPAYTYSTALLALSRYNSLQ